MILYPNNNRLPDTSSPYGRRPVLLTVYLTLTFSFFQMYFCKNEYNKMLLLLAVMVQYFTLHMEVLGVN